MEVLIALGAFVASHVLIARTRLKPALIARFGERAYLAGYSLLSLLLLGWVIWAVVEAERHLLWVAPFWAHGFAAILSLVSFVLIGIGIVTPNPLSISFRQTGFDPGRPGIIGWLHHPLIWGLTLWAIAHIPANGDWPSLALFAGLAGFGAIGVYAVGRRRRRLLGADEWRRMTAGSGHLDREALIGSALGVGLWALFLAIHPVLFGADPLAVLQGQLG